MLILLSFTNSRTDYDDRNQLDRNNDEKISWQEFEWGRQSLPSSIQRPLNELFLAEKKRDINFSQFINVVGPVYLEFAKLEKQGVRFNQLCRCTRASFKPPRKFYILNFESMFRGGQTEPAF